MEMSSCYWYGNQILYQIVSEAHVVQREEQVWNKPYATVLELFEDIIRQSNEEAEGI